MILSPISITRLAEVHADLRKVIMEASRDNGLDFMVTEGKRTKSRQRTLFNAGATRTMNSRHLTGHAVDLAVYVNKVIRWDWPLYHDLAVRIKAAAARVNVPIEWGGDWETFKDGPHYQLPWGSYP